MRFFGESRTHLSLRYPPPRQTRRYPDTATSRCCAPPNGLDFGCMAFAGLPDGDAGERVRFYGTLLPYRLSSPKNLIHYHLCARSSLGQSAHCFRPKRPSRSRQQRSAHGCAAAAFYSSAHAIRVFGAGAAPASMDRRVASAPLRARPALCAGVYFPFSPAS